MRNHVRFFLNFVFDGSLREGSFEMDITAFIRELLFSHDCVIVPGFGGFIGNYTPASIDKTTSTFYPPVKQISFNRNLDHNDGLLVGRISKSSGLSYGDSRNLVDEFVISLRKRLNRGEKVAFDHIGTFFSNQEGNIQFEPDRSVNYHLDSYGLESFQFSPLEIYDVRKRITKHINREPVRHSSARKILWRAAVIVPILVLMVAVPLRTDLFKSKVEVSNLNPLVTVEQGNGEKDEATVEIITEPVKEEITEALPGDTEGQAVIVEKSQATEKSGIDYHLITGSFRSKDNADQHASILSSEGYIPEIIAAPNGFFRVSAVRCGDLDAAIREKESLSGKYPGTWVKKI